MAAGALATYAGAALLMYYLLSRRLAAKGDEDDRSDNLSESIRSGRRRISRRPAQAPATWFETITTLSETLRFTYAETLGKWPIGDLAFGINYLMRRQVRSCFLEIFCCSICQTRIAIFHWTTCVRLLFSFFFFFFFVLVRFKSVNLHKIPIVVWETHFLCA